MTPFDLVWNLWASQLTSKYTHITAILVVKSQFWWQMDLSHCASKTRNHCRVHLVFRGSLSTKVPKFGLFMHQLRSWYSIAVLLFRHSCSSSFPFSGDAYITHPIDRICLPVQFSQHRGGVQQDHWERPPEGLREKRVVWEGAEKQGECERRTSVSTESDSAERRGRNGHQKSARGAGGEKSTSECKKKEKWRWENRKRADNSYQAVNEEPAEL